MYNRENSLPAVANSIFSGNRAGEFGAGMHNNDSSPTITNCTFYSNMANLKASIFNGGGIQNTSTSEPTLTNSILWGNSPDQMPIEYGSPVVTYCDINESRFGEVNGDADVDGNIRLDPSFIDADGSDNIVGTADDNFRLSAGSPCIDMVDNSAIPVDTADLDHDGDKTETLPEDFEGEERILDGDDDGTATVDIGEDETPFVATCPGDFDNDNDLDGLDLANLAYDLGQMNIAEFSTNFGGEDCK